MTVICEWCGEIMIIRKIEGTNREKLCCLQNCTSIPIITGLSIPDQSESYSTGGECPE